ncbi:MAG: molecular chaperone GrpE [Candidatus Hadarchaeum yellowstonense]|jgi:molecular chaperone GrpE|uniref:Protein GrpE n=1 Tax=Hadarchaeum yellowstonense TaxID=1776334 RepID=A0A147JUX4_HADYE|nr:MAG: molecular chaperone GrpE [Candidatus Hadarchaeum yellowstonense]
MSAEVNLETQKLQERLVELQREMEEKTRLAEERLNQLKYLQADFENYRKSLDREKEMIIELANENLVKDLLVILDDFERALQGMEEGKSKEGLAMLYRNFLRVLEKHGLKPIEAVGKKFDPYYHEAVLREKSEQEEGTILEELQRGYMFKSKVIRHSKVKVAENCGEG